MKTSIIVMLAAVTLVSSFAGVALAQGRGDSGGGRGGRGGSDGMEYKMRRIAENQRYVKRDDGVFCFLRKVRRHDAYGNRYFDHVRVCETRVVDVY
jgi:hypothetical protein